MIGEDKRDVIREGDICLAKAFVDLGLGFNKFYLSEPSKEMIAVADEFCIFNGDLEVEVGYTFNKYILSVHVSGKCIHAEECPDLEWWTKEGQRDYVLSYIEQIVLDRWELQPREDNNG